MIKKVTSKSILILSVLQVLVWTRTSSSFAAGNDNIVYVVHAIDTEPDEIDEFQFAQELDLFDFQPDGVVEQSFNPAWRLDHLDSFGNPPKFTWFLMTHEAFCQSPQGCNAVPEAMFGNFQSDIAEWGDEIAWHYHHSDWVDDEWKQLTTFDGTVYREKTDIELATSHLAMLVMESGFFPEGYRAGWTWENTDLSNWLEDLILFDFSNNWNNVPPGKNQWSTYHPSRDNFKEEGEMSRWIVKCKQGSMTQQDVNDAFQLASESGKAILCFSSHTYVGQTILYDLVALEEYLQSASADYGIPYTYVGAKEAMHLWLGQTDEEPPILTVSVAHRVVYAECSEELCNPPFLALRHIGGDYSGRFMQPDGNNWSCYVDDTTAVSAVVGAVDLAGNSAVSATIADISLCSVEIPPCGDMNGNGTVNITDLTFLIQYLFNEGRTPCETNSADVDGSGTINIADLTFLVDYFLKGGIEPVCP